MQAHLVEAQHPQSEHFDVVSSETRSGESSGNSTSGPTIMDPDPLVVYNRNRGGLTWIAGLCIEFLPSLIGNR